MALPLLGGGKINPSPCTEEDALRNWQLQSVINNNIINIINAGAVDTFTVKVDADDPLPGFLFSKLANQASFTEEAHQLVYAEVVEDNGAIKVNLFTALGEGGGGSEGDGDERVKVSSNDQAADYLLDKRSDTNEYSEGSDILVFAQEVGDGGNETLREFIDTSEISGYDSEGTLFLGLEDGSIGFHEFPEIPEFEDTYRLKVNEADNDPDFLHSKIVDQRAYNSDTDQPVYAQVVGNQVKLFTEVVSEGGEGGDGQCPRWFELVEPKLASEQSATIIWLDDDGQYIGSPDNPLDLDTVHDDMRVFTGRPAGYVDGADGARGYALCGHIQRMEGWASWAVAEYVYVEGDGYQWRLIEFGGDQWNRKQPAEFDAPLNVTDLGDFWSHNLHAGEKALLKLVDPDDSGEPQYAVVAMRQRSDIVQVVSESESHPAGHPATQTTDGMFRGRLVGLLGAEPGDSDTVEDIWITDLSGATTLANKSFHLAKFVGLYDPDPEGSNSDSRPRFAIERGTPPELVWAWSTSVSASDGDPVAPAGGKYDGKIIRYRSGTLDSNSNYEAGSEVKLFWPDGNTEPLGHRDRLTAFHVGEEDGTPLYALLGTTGGEGGAVTVLIDDDIEAIEWNEASQSFGPSVLSLKYFAPSGESYKLVENPEQEGEFLTLEVEYHDVSGFVVGTVDGDPESDNNRYLGVAVKNNDGAYVLTTIFCKPLPPVEEEEE